jgi:hypothetical protein
VLPAFELPEWGLRGIIIVLAAGVPIACLLAWACDLTADGIQRDTADALPAPAPLIRRLMKAKKLPAPLFSPKNGGS